MSLSPNAGLSDTQVEQRLRRIADLIGRADALIQSTFEADDELYAVCTVLQDLSADFEMEADELASLSND